MSTFLMIIGIFYMIGSIAYLGYVINLMVGLYRQGNIVIGVNRNTLYASFCVVMLISVYYFIKNIGEIIQDVYTEFA